MVEEQRKVVRWGDVKIRHAWYCKNGKRWSSNPVKWSQNRKEQHWKRRRSDKSVHMLVLQNPFSKPSIEMSTIWWILKKSTTRIQIRLIFKITLTVLPKLWLKIIWFPIRQFSTQVITKSDIIWFSGRNGEMTQKVNRENYLICIIP